jgi:hypothetical protein
VAQRYKPTVGQALAGPAETWADSEFKGDATCDSDIAKLWHITPPQVDSHGPSEAGVDPWVGTVDEGLALGSRASSDAGWEMPSQAGRPRKRASSSQASAAGASQVSSKASRISNAMSAFDGLRKPKSPPSA